MLEGKKELSKISFSMSLHDIPTPNNETISTSNYAKKMKQSQLLHFSELFKIRIYCQQQVPDDLADEHTLRPILPNHSFS